MLSKHLTEADRDQVLRHYARLDADDLRLRFGYQASAEALQGYVQSLDFAHDALFGVFDAELQLQALAHLAIGHPDRTVAEFGVSVLKTCRHQGMGLALLERCIEHAANAGVQELLIQTLAENKPMLRLMLKHTKDIESEGSERLAHLPIAEGSVLTRLHEMSLDEMAAVRHLFDQTRDHARRLWRSIRHYRHHGAWLHSEQLVPFVHKPHA